MVKEREIYGQYFTPKWIVNYLIDRIFSLHINNNKEINLTDIKVIDPSCGNGIFLQAVYSYLQKYYIENHIYNSNSDKIHTSIISNNLYGIDIDINAFNNSLKVLNCKKEHSNIKNIDALLSLTNKDNTSSDEHNLSLNSWKFIFSDLEEGFDIIIGNPPWGIYSDAQSRKAYSIYKTSKKQFDSWSIFLEKSIENLKKNGYLGFILPNTILLNENYQPIRSFILDKTNLVEIINLGEKIFSKVSQPCLLLIIRKKESSRSISDKNTVSIIPYISEKDLKLLHEEKIGLDELSHHNVQETDIIFTEENLINIFNIDLNLEKIAIEKDFHTEKMHVKPLKDLVQNYRGVEINKQGLIIQCPICRNWSPPRRKGIGMNSTCANPTCGEILPDSLIKQYIVSSSSINDNQQKFLVGESINRYTIKDYKYIVPDKTGINYKNETIYKGPKLLVRKTGHQINAVVDYSDAWVIQVIYFFKLKEKISKFITLEYLMAILNSNLLHEYYYSLYGDRYRKEFPHFTQKRLLSLPIRIPLTDKERTLASKISQLGREMIFNKNKDYIEIEKLDNLIKELYEIT